jgi:plastocyanin
VTIDDNNGYQPSLVYLKVGSTITWVNQGQKYHGVKQRLGVGAPDGYHPLDSGVLDPGDSYSYTFSCPPGGACTGLVGPFDYLSTIGYDAIGPGSDGFGSFGSTAGTNSSLYVGRVFLVP